MLFVCTGNSARSQMAEGLLRHLSGGRVEVASAGTDPRGVHPLAVRVMAEWGIDISHHESKPLIRFAREPFDWVITVCDQAKETCPVVPGARTVHWPIPDPAEERGSEEAALVAFRTARDMLHARIQRFLDELGLVGYAPR